MFADHFGGRWLSTVIRLVAIPDLLGLCDSTSFGVSESRLPV